LCLLGQKSIAIESGFLSVDHAPDPETAVMQLLDQDELPDCPTGILDAALKPHAKFLLHAFKVVDPTD